MLRLQSLLVLVSFLIPLALTSAAAQPQPASRNPDYRWPLDVPPVLVSSFGEFRATHLHAGLDLSTGGRSGLKCYAVGDGWVARMRMSPFGYGKALYLQLDVGPLVVYAHLSRFAGDIADRAWAEQLRRRGFTFDIYLQRDEIRVRRGDVIAWSGASGIGHPHLHFEVRDGDVARNPQTAGFAVRDVLRPTIRDVSILPLSIHAHVEGGFEPHVIPAERAVPDRQPVRVAGAVGFAVQAIDKAGDGPYRQAPYGYEVRVDGKLLYSALHERFDYAHNHHSKLDYDQDRLVFNNRRSLQLFARRGNRLHGRQPAHDGRGVLFAGQPAPPAANGGDWFQVESGRHEVSIRVYDVAGNERQVTFPILVDDVPRIERLLARRDDTGWQALCEATDDVEMRSVFLSLRVPADPGASTPAEDDAWVELVSTRHGDRWTAPIPATVQPPFVLRAVARDASGLEALQTWGEPAATAAGATEAEPLEIEPSWRHGRLQLAIQSRDWLTRSPQVFVEDADGKRVQLRDLVRSGSRGYVVLATLPQLPASPRRVLVESQALSGQTFTQALPLEAEIVAHGTARRVVGLQPGWELDVEPTSFFDDIAVRMQAFDSTALPLGRELRSTGIAVAMESREAPTNRRVQVRYRPHPEAAAPLPANAALFYVDRSGNLRFLSAERDAEGALIGRARYLTVFAVLEDTTPPRLQQFRHTTRRSGTPQLQFRVTDAGADLDDDALSVSIDGTLAIPEWDPETTRVVVHPTEDLTAGTHTLRVVAVDQVGNRSERSWTFEHP